MTTYRIDDVEITAEVTAVEVAPDLLGSDAENGARQAGEADGRAMIPDSDVHPPFIRKIEAAALTALDRLAERRAHADGSRARAQRAVFSEYCAAKEASEDAKTDPLYNPVRLVLASGVTLAAVAASYAGLHQIANPARALLALGFGASFAVGSHLRLGVGHYRRGDGVRPVAGDVLTALALSCAVLIGLAVEWTSPWTPVRWLTSGAVAAILSLCWFAGGTAARSHPPIARALTSWRLRQAERIYLELVETRRSEWEEYGRRAHATVARASELMNLYYHCNLLARRNSLSTGVIEASGVDLPTVPAPAWVDDGTPDFDPGGLADWKKGP